MTGTENNTPLVSVRDLKIGAVTDSGRKVEIIKGVDFDIAPGEILALIGESGSGKTTIALSLMGHTRPGCSIQGGQIRVGENDVTAMSGRARAGMRGTQVSYVRNPPQRPSTRPSGSSIRSSKQPKFTN